MTPIMFAAALAAIPAPSPALAFLEGIGAGEMVLVALIGLLLFGGKGMPDMARTLGRTIREFKKATQGFEDEVKRVMNEEPEPPRPRKPRLAPPVALPAPPAASVAAPRETPPPPSSPTDQTPSA